MTYILFLICSQEQLQIILVLINYPRSNPQIQILIIYNLFILSLYMILFSFALINEFECVLEK